MGLFAGENNFFGLDIGTTGIRIVQLKKGGVKPSLVSYGHIDMPMQLFMSDAPMDLDKVAELIRSLLKQTKISTTKVVASIPSSQAFSTVITTPKLNPQELSKAMLLQADQYIPMAVDQVKMDWQVIGPGKTDQEMQVLLVAAPNSVIARYLGVIERVGLELEALEINAVALSRSLMPLQNDIAALILDVASLASDIAIVHNQAPKLIRSVQIGGTTFVRAAQQALGLDEDQAKQFVRKFGLTQTKLEGQVLKALKPSLDTLMAEVDKSIKYFANQYPDVKLEKLILTGGTAALPELPIYLANSTGLPVELGNPWGGVSYPPESQEQLMSLANEYAVSVGLAMR